MSLEVRYYSPTTPDADGWSEDIGDALRDGDIGGLVAEFELGAVGSSNLPLDDPEQSVGHDGDAIAGLKQLAVTETAAPAGRRRIWTGYVADRAYDHREDESLFLAGQRGIDPTLVDLNSFLSFRVLGVDETSAFNRPAETDIERVTALLAVDFLSTTLLAAIVASTGGVDMDAVDYTGQYPIDVLNDCAQQSGRNFAVLYDEDGSLTGTEGAFGLFYEFNDAPVYLSDMRVSNVADEVDDAVTFPPVGLDAQLVRDPSRVFAGVLVQYAGGHEYRTKPETAVTYGWRDAVVSAPNVKTAAKAQARGDRYLADASDEDDTLTFSVLLPRAHVNDWRAGEAGQVHFAHLPGYSADFRQVRCIRRTVRQDLSEPVRFYTIVYVATPMTPTPSGAADRWKSGDGSLSSGGSESGAIPILPRATTPGNLLVALYAIQGDLSETDVAEPSYETVDDHSDYAWTTQEFVHGQDATANVNHSHPVADPGPGSSPVPPMAFGIVWRHVQPGEETVQPLRVVKANPAHQVTTWLWEFPTTEDPPASTSVQLDDSTTPFSDGYTGTGSVTVGSDLDGWVLGGFTVGMVDYGPTAVITPTNGETIRAAGSGGHGVNGLNDHAPHVSAAGDPFRWQLPWSWIGQSQDGTALAVSMSIHDAPEWNYYNHTSVMGAAIVIPGNRRPIPDIPYPANQSA
jgi:hypothetical protein